jgi:hypothetical protein
LKQIPAPTTDYLLDLQLVSTSNPLANQNYLQVTSAPFTQTVVFPAGTVQQRAFPPVDANQVYSAVLINRITGAASLPGYFQACKITVIFSDPCDDITILACRSTW